MPMNTRPTTRAKESVTNRLNRLEAAVKQLKKLVALRPLVPNDETIDAMDAAHRGDFEFTGSVDEFRAHLRDLDKGGGNDANG
jgi:hypothetical protein